MRSDRRLIGWGIIFLLLGAVPLSVRGRTLGALRFSFNEPRLFDEYERNFVVAMAAQTGQWWMATPTVSTPPAPTSPQPITLGSPPTTTTTNTGPISSVLGTH